MRFQTAQSNNRPLEDNIALVSTTVITIIILDSNFVYPLQTWSWLTEEFF